MTIDLSGQVILVTGASRGIGAAIAQHLGQAGATVAVHYGRNAERARTVAEAAGHGARTFQADLADAEDTARLWEEVRTAFPRVDALVNNAGVSPETGLGLDDDDWQTAWQQTVQVNLRAPEQLCRSAIRHFQQHGGGRIVNVASRAAFRGDTADYMTYAASKGGLVALTRSIARGFGKDHIKAFTLAPGFVQTDMAQPFVDAYGEAYITDDLALPALTQPRDIAPHVVFLLSGLADHATGCTLDVNAGSYVH
ncbi:MAG: SDR family oxidoreductase [Rhodothermales bacterium]